MVSRAGNALPAAVAAGIGLVVCALLAGGCGHAENSLLLIEKLPDVKSITFEGNDRFDDGTLKSLMVLREGSWWNPFKDHKYRKALLKSDLNAILTYYMRHGYLRVQILDQQVRTSDDGVHILVRISEGEPVFTKEVVILGARALNPNRLREKLALKPDRPLDPFRLADDRRLILNTLAQQGYWQAAVRAEVQFFGDRALVFYVLDEGDPVSVRDVTVTGTKQVNPSLVRRDISVKTGKPLRLDDLSKSQVRLLQSGLFADAQWDTAGLDTLKDDVAVRFRVRERRLHWYETGVGVSSQQLIRVTAGWGARNFLGTGMRFAVNNRTDLDPTNRVPTLLDETRTEAILNRSHLFGTQWEGQPSVFFDHDRGALQDTIPYRQSTVGAAASTRRRFGDLRNQVVLTLENRWVNNDADPRARLIDPQFYRDTYQTRLLSGWVERDSRNAFFSPTRGTYQTALVQFAGGALGGNNSFLKQTAGTINFFTMPVTSWTLATRLRVGYIVPGSNDSTVSGRRIDTPVELIPNEDRYLLGGATTVRGYTQDELDGAAGGSSNAQGGLASLLVSVETRFPLFWRLSGVFFTDAGNVWQDRRFLTLDRLVPHQDRTEVSPYDLRYTYGLGVRFNTALGPIRVDYARKWNRPVDYQGGKDGWHVALGHAF
jgi:outer membrane protein insertion porin family